MVRSAISTGRTEVPSKVRRELIQSQLFDMVRRRPAGIAQRNFARKAGAFANAVEEPRGAADCQAKLESVSSHGRGFARASISTPFDYAPRVLANVDEPSGEYNA